MKDRNNISIILSYPKDAFQKDKALKSFISLDKPLTSLEILTQYTDRWEIEPFFRDFKTYLGLDGYQVRSEKYKVIYIYEAAANGTPIEEIFESLKINNKH